MSERANKLSEQGGTSERVGGGANGRVSGPVPASGFLRILDHSAFRKGFSTVIDFLTKDLKWEEKLLNSPVDEIRWGDEGRIQINLNLFLRDTWVRKFLSLFTSLFL